MASQERNGAYDRTGDLTVAYPFTIGGMNCDSLTALRRSKSLWT
jgi:hypothetical protein